MALNLTDYGAKVLNDHLWGRIEFPFSTPKYLMLSSIALTKAGSLAGEITQSGYARISIPSLMGDTVLATGTIANAAVITFGPASPAVDWDQIVDAGLMDSSTIGAGNMLCWMPAVTTRLVVAQDDFKIQIGQLTFRLR